MKLLTLPRRDHTQLVEQRQPVNDEWSALHAYFEALNMASDGGLYLSDIPKDHGVQKQPGQPGSQVMLSQDRITGCCF